MLKVNLSFCRQVDRHIQQSMHDSVRSHSESVIRYQWEAVKHTVHFFTEKGRMYNVCMYECMYARHCMIYGNNELIGLMLLRYIHTHIHTC